MCDAMKSFQAVLWLLFGAGAIPCRRRTLPTVWSETWWPRWGQSANDPVVAPAGVLARHLHNQTLHFGINPRPTGVCAMLRVIELLRNQFPEPGENGLGFGDLGYFRQSLTSQFLADLRQRGALLMGKAQPSWRMCLEDPVLRDKIFDLKQQFLIDQPRHVCQQTGHLVAFHPACIFSNL